MNSHDSVLLAMGIVAFSIGIVIYVRKRLAIRRILQSGEPIAVDGWNTFPDEPEFPDIIKTQQNEAFGQFCNVALYGLIVSAAAYGFDIKSDIYSFLLDHQ